MPTTNGFTHTEKQPGDLIQSADWNAAMAEIERLEGAKVNKNGIASLQGPLTIAEALQVSDNLTVNGDTALNGTLTTTGNTTVGGTLTVTNDTTLNQTLTVSGNTDIGGTLNVGTTEHSSDVNVVGNVEVSGAIRANTFVYTNPMRHRMFPGDPLVYQDIFEAKEAGAIRKIGSPGGYNDTDFNTASKAWYSRRLIAYGGDKEADGNGAEVTIPDGYDTVWVRVLGERWTIVKAYFLDGERESLGLWSGGRRYANCYCPDGSLADGRHMEGDSNALAHQWLPIPAGRSGKLALIAKQGTVYDFWFSGLAFSRNPWAHATQAAKGYHKQINGGEPVTWSEDNRNGDVRAALYAGSNLELKVPVVRSGRDKLLYLIEFNESAWNGCMHNGITVNSIPIERFIATYDNPFARHWNSKTHQRYLAARIPESLISTGPTVDYLNVRIDMRNKVRNFLTLPFSRYRDRKACLGSSSKIGHSGLEDSTQQAL